MKRRKSCSLATAGDGVVHSHPTHDLAQGHEAAHRLLESVDNEFRRQIIAFADRHDLLTGLLNFHSLVSDLDSALRACSPGEETAVIWLDILNLRREFVLWGVDASESLLRNVADALRGSVGKDALLGRFGDMCFVAAIPANKSDPMAHMGMQALLNRVLESGAGGLEATPEVAAGVSFFPSDARGAKELLRYSSLAATRARYTSSTSVVNFQPGMKKHLMRSHLLEVEMGKSLERDEFSMLYQPKVDLITGGVLGAEALMRWQHPEWGAVPPSEFIPVAERSDLIQRVFDFSLKSALKDAGRWIKLGIAPGIISVNVSAANLRREDFSRRVRRLMTDFPIEPMQLELEVTESLLLDDEELFTARMRQLKTVGVRLAIDDFGTRYTGFNLLKRLPLDVMKIDRCFIRGIHQSIDMRTLCSTIIAMARHMKLRTVAEGIEEPEELEVMRQIGCDAGQGYLFERPISSEAFIAFLHDWPQRRTKLHFGNPVHTPSTEALSGPM